MAQFIEVQIVAREDDPVTHRTFINKHTIHSVFWNDIDCTTKIRFTNTTNIMEVEDPLDDLIDKLNAND